MSSVVLEPKDELQRPILCFHGADKRQISGTEKSVRGLWEQGEDPTQPGSNAVREGFLEDVAPKLV